MNDILKINIKKLEFNVYYIQVVFKDNTTETVKRFNVNFKDVINFLIQVYNI